MNLSSRRTSQNIPGCSININYMATLTLASAQQHMRHRPPAYYLRVASPPCHVLSLNLGALGEARKEQVAAQATSIDFKIQKQLAAAKQARQQQQQRRAVKRKAAPVESDSEEEEEEETDSDAPLPGELDSSDSEEEEEEDKDAPLPGELESDEGSEDGEESEDDDNDGGGDDEQHQRSSRQHQRSNGAGPAEQSAAKRSQQQQQQQQQVQREHDSGEDESDEDEAPAGQQQRRQQQAAKQRTEGGGAGGFFSAAPADTRFSAASFADLNLSRPLVKACAALGYAHPTPIQAACIPLALTGRDICGSAVTGSGEETAAAADAAPAPALAPRASPVGEASAAATAHELAAPLPPLPGKTAAFSLPLLERLLHRSRRVAATYVLVLTPVRELAVQARGRRGGKAGGLPRRPSPGR